MIKDVEHFFRCFSAIQYYSVENSLFSSVPHFLIGLFDFLESTFLSSLYIFDISPLSEKEEHSSIVGGIASLYNHSGNQSGSSSENWT